MRVELYSAVLNQAAELSGRQYDDGFGAIKLAPADAVVFRTYIGEAVRRAWTAQAWPETTVHTFRRWARTWIEGTTYVRGDVVWWPVTEAYYVCIAASTTNAPTWSLVIGGDQVLAADLWYPLADEYSADEWLYNVQYTVGDLVRLAYLNQFYVLAVSAAPGVVPTNASFWSPIDPLERRVAWDQDWETDTLGDPYGVYLDNPLTTEEPREVTYTWDSEGMRVLDLVDGVWIHAWLPEPDFLTEPATVLRRFAQFAAITAAGLMLRAEGKTDQGNQFLKLAQGILEDESTKFTRRESRSGRIRIR